MNEHRIVSVRTTTRRPANHAVVVGVATSGDDASERQWTLRDVLSAMNGATRFYSLAPNGRHARVQRFKCEFCGADHIRTHISDKAIHDLANLPRSASQHQIGEAPVAAL